jgi:hypothetical protein
MKNLAPVALMLVLLLAFVSFVSAQDRVKNPDLPQCLVFQWKITTDQVASTWKNDDFFITRDQEGMQVYYGAYFNIADALNNIPKLPEGIDAADLMLVPFFNQVSIRPEDALMLLSDRTPFETGQRDPSALENISFTVYFATFDSPRGRSLMANIEEPLSFEVSARQAYAYSAGLFSDLSSAEQYANHLRSMGYPNAQVNKYLNGEKLAMNDLDLLGSYIAYVEEHVSKRTISF